MKSTFAMRGLEVRTARAEPSYVFVSTRWVTVTIWLLLWSIFLFDMLTPPENISVGFAYAVPIFMSLFELRPRAFLYAGTATTLSLAGPFIQPPGDLTAEVIAANRLIAVATQWLCAMLVRAQYRRHVDAQREAEFQRRFVDILSHEVGTALTTITGQAYRLTKLSEQLAPSDLRIRAEKIRNAAERIEAIVDRVQFASSLGDGSIPIGLEAVDLNAMMRRLAEQLSEEHQGGAIELNTSSELEVVRADEMLLRQVFENVIVNSIKYSSCATPIAINIENHGSMSRITIADQGSGIPSCELPRVREPYYRGQSSKGTSGAGLGLYFADRIVEAHAGRLFVESEVGRGTKVIIDLPRSADPVAS
jgi:signal transduction histidine kinase